MTLEGNDEILISGVFLSGVPARSVCSKQGRAGLERIREKEKAKRRAEELDNG